MRGGLSVVPETLVSPLEVQEVCAVADASHEGCEGGGPDDLVWIRGVDYVSAWLDAEEAAELINQAAMALGLDGHGVRAVPHAGPHGEPVVWMTPEAGRVVGALLTWLANQS